ncbi:MAG: molybdate ABC transporter permease subunit [Aquificae bacterium]|nr:molybdate ABC transporter permease subunit [Aquificota bacterium]
MFFVDTEFIQTLTITFKLATLTTLILVIIGVPIGYFLAYSKHKLKPILETLIAMPIVLPSTVIGFYFLIVFSPDTIIGGFFEKVLDLKLIFTFEGLVVASVIYSLPFMVHPVQSGFLSVPKSLIEASLTLGKSRIETFFRVLIPNIKPSILTGIVLSFAHTIGEFGVVLMVGGSIPGETKVASIAIYEEVEALNYDKAHLYSIILFIISFLILLSLFYINKKIVRADKL